MENNLKRYGDRFAQRILTDAEFADFTDVVNRAHFLAKRFAAKEAAVKAMGTGFSHGIALRQISVTHNTHGKPGLRFSGGAAEFIKRHNILETHISLADEEDHAVAFVTMTTA